MTGFRASDRQIRGLGAPAADGAVELGEVVEVDGTHVSHANGQTTFVHVRLLRGDQPTLLCRISQPMNAVPPVGTSVMVAVPAGFGYSPGAPMIIGWGGVSPENQFTADKAKLDFGPECDLVIKARSITITDYENRYLTLGPDYGFKVGDEEASGCNMQNGKWLFYASEDEEAKATFQLSGSEGIKLLHKDVPSNSGFTFKGGKFISFGLKFEAQFTLGMLGKSATSANGIGWGVGAASLMSTSWCVAVGP